MDCLVLNAIVIATLHYSCACRKKKDLSAQPKNVYILLCNHTKRQTDKTRGVCGPHTVISVTSVTWTRTICAAVLLQYHYRMLWRCMPTHVHQKIRQCSAMARGGKSCLTSYSNTGGSCIGILITCFPPCGRRNMEMASGKWGAEGYRNENGVSGGIVIDIMKWAVIPHGRGKQRETLTRSGFLLAGVKVRRSEQHNQNPDREKYEAPHRLPRMCVWLIKWSGWCLTGDRCLINYIEFWVD